MTTPSSRPGYIFLISIIIVGAVISATSATLFLLGLGAELTGYAVAESLQAYEHAQTCAERALRNLRADLGYVGRETAEFSSGRCTVATAGGSGNYDRTLCMEGVSGDTKRRLEIEIFRVYPTTRIGAWKEVTAFTRCPE